MIIVHAAVKRDWEDAQIKGIYQPIHFESLKKGGFIHCSEIENIVNVANDNLTKVTAPMLLLCIDTDKLTSEIKWEERGNGGIKFPHVYGPINLEAVVETFDFKKDNEGMFFYPDEILKYVKYEKSCGAIIFHKFNDETKVLLINHVHGNHWAFPKGHVENDETEEETAIREILEETGLNVSLDVNFRYSTRYAPKKGVIKDVIYFAASTNEIESTIQVEELNSAKWCSFDEARELITFKNNLMVFNAAVSYIERNSFCESI